MRVNGDWAFPHHGNLEQISDGVDLSSGALGTFAVSWLWDINGSIADVFSK